MREFFAAFALVLGLICQSLKSEAVVLYRYLDIHGIPVIASEPPPVRPAYINRKLYFPLVLQASYMTKLKPTLLAAIIINESNWNNLSISDKGALGLMQLMPETAKNWGVTDAFDPQQNITGGARYLRHLLNLFSNDLSLALAAYHAGENRVIREGNIPEIQSTKNYVKSVLRTYALENHPPRMTVMPPSKLAVR